MYNNGKIPVEVSGLNQVLSHCNDLMDKAKLMHQNSNKSESFIKLDELVKDNMSSKTLFYV